MSFGRYIIREPSNEPIFDYAPGTKERIALKEELLKLQSKIINLPLIINGKEIKTSEQIDILAPHDHSIILGKASLANKEHIDQAIDAALKAKEEWMEFNWDERAAIFMKAAELLSGPYRMVLNAATMLNLSKNPYQAEIDSAAELIDFLRFNTFYMYKLYGEQPFSPSTAFNRLEYRPLDGFIFAVTPFNFTSIMGNLPSAPTMMGNVVLWKPASSVIYTAFHIMKLFQKAGLPDGVINFIPGKSSIIGDIILEHPDLGGIHFTGSNATFDYMWKKIGNNIANYKQYPRLVGETGGKDFVFIHESADLSAVLAALTRGAFEYQGQKCSAASRVYAPRKLWPQIKKCLEKDLSEIKIGKPDDFSNFINAVIDKEAFTRITSYIELVKQSREAKIILGGNYSDEKGYFIDPTVILTENPKFITMTEEIFGPVLTIYLYDEDKYIETLQLCDQSTKYGLTGSIFAEDRKAVSIATKILRHAAGNFYINIKPTGAVVNQQPFGGSRRSGTNDKAGSYLNLIRWVSPRSIKERFYPPRKYTYTFLEEE
ncbi:MAG: L-glutamate gamma-semialdehyde dehydrogenase [Candidatus Heimdallarchaeota archaeon]|nr:L-glutamate gamma-semialdehyde dehydrogenase [Candidatus Heimdallarchaeota archaeon]